MTAHAYRNPEEQLIDGLTRTQLMATYAPKISFIARRIAHRLPPNAPLELDDLINSGALGLLDAIDKYDATKMVKFGTYAEFRIRGAILDVLRRIDPVSRNVREKANEVQKTIRDLEGALGRPPSSDEVAKALRISVVEYQDLLEEVRPVTLVSLDSPKPGTDQDRRPLNEVIEDDREESPDGELSKRQAVDLLKEAIDDSLPERLRLVLTLYYFQEMNLKEIGAVLGVTESRVSQMHTEACLRLRSRLGDLLRPGETIPRKQKTRRTRGRAAVLDATPAMESGEDEAELKKVSNG